MISISIGQKSELYCQRFSFDLPRFDKFCPVMKSIAQKTIFPAPRACSGLFSFSSATKFYREGQQSPAQLQKKKEEEEEKKTEGDRSLQHNSRYAHSRLATFVFLFVMTSIFVHCVFDCLPFRALGSGGRGQNGRGQRGRGSSKGGRRGGAMNWGRGANNMGGGHSNIELNQKITQARSPETILGLYNSHGEEYDVVNMATSLHRMAKIGKRRAREWATGELFLRFKNDLRQRLRRTPAAFKPQNLANVAWAFATAKVDAKDMFEAVASEVSREGRLRDLNPQNIANTAWAFATAKVDAKDMFEALASEVLREGRLRQFDPQAIANTVWAFAKAKVDAKDMFEALALELSREGRLRELSPQDIATTAWAFATAKVDAKDMFEALASEVSKRDLLPQMSKEGKHMYLSSIR